MFLITAKSFEAKIAAVNPSKSFQSIATEISLIGRPFSSNATAIFNLSAYSK